MQILASQQNALHGKRYRDRILTKNPVEIGQESLVCEFARERLFRCVPQSIRGGVALLQAGDEACHLPGDLRRRWRRGAVRHNGGKQPTGFTSGERSCG